MADPLIPPELAGLGWVAGAVGLVLALGKALGELGTARATHAKLDAERAAADALREKSLAERDLAETLGERAHTELRDAGMPGVAALLTSALLNIDHLSAELQDEREASIGFRGAVLEFIAVVALALPDMQDVVRGKIADALDVLRHHDGWER